MSTWQVQSAKARLSELLDQADREGPQTISRHGKPRAVVVSIADYRRMETANAGFVAHLLGGPKVDDLEVQRDPDVGRDVAL